VARTVIAYWSERARGTRPFAPGPHTPVLGRGAGGNDLGAAVIGAKQTRYAQVEPFSENSARITGQADSSLTIGKALHWDEFIEDMSVD